MEHRAGPDQDRHGTAGPHGARVTTGLLGTMIGLQPVGREMFATANYVSQRNEYGK